MAELIPGARLVVVERAGHVLALEHPEAVNAVLEEHLASLPAAA
jgi:pimeloyl-ACP methyl ester carboxylesterase